MSLTQTAKRFFSYLKPFKKTLILMLMMGIISGASAIFLTELTGKTINILTRSTSLFSNNFIRAIILFISCIIITTLTQWYVQRLSFDVAYQSIDYLRQQAIQHLNQLSIRDFDQFDTGDIVSRFTNDLDNVSTAIQQLLVSIFSSIMTVIIALVVMFSLNIPLTLVILCTTPFIFLMTYIVARHGQHYFQKQQAIIGQLTAFSEEYIHEQSLVDLYHQQDNVQQQFEAINDSLYKSGQHAQFISSLTNPLSRFVDHITYALIGLIGGFIIYHSSGSIAVGLLSSFTLYASQFSKPFIELSGILTQIQTAIVGLNRVFDILDTPIESCTEPQHQLKNPKGKIDFDNVTFGYQKEHPVIRHFSLHVQPGEQIAIIGKTGAGKSTLINLLLRFYEVQDGMIYIDDQPITTIDKASLRQHFGLVLQDTWFFNGSIIDNLRFACPNASREKVIQAAKTANAHPFIKRLPHGYDTILDEHANLSEGERQLLSIARTLLSNPKILVLDEATSSLDTLTEKRVQEAFERLMQNRTSFIIAHRLATIQKSNQILIVEDGTIIEHGTHHELIHNQHSHYYQLYHDQFKN